MLENRMIKDRLHLLSQKKGLGLSSMYPAPVNEIPQIQDHLNGADFPEAKGISERLLTLPTHPFLKDDDRQFICKMCEPFLKTGSLPESMADSSREKVE